MKFKMHSAGFLIVGCVTLFGSCGVRFANAPVNADLGNVLDKRAIYESRVEPYTFQDLAGSILSIKDTLNPIKIGVISPAGFKDSVIPITDAQSLNFYHSIIQRGAEAQGSYLAFAANFSADQMAELTITDIARAGVILDQNNFAEISSKLIDWVATHPRIDTTYRRIWIQSVVLSAKLYNSGTKIKADASGQVGSVVGLKTGVYNTNGETIKSTIIAFESIDVDQFAGQAKSSAAAHDVVETKAMQYNRFTAMIKGLKPYNSIIRKAIVDGLK